MGAMKILRSSVFWDVLMLVARGPLMLEALGPSRWGLLSGRRSSARPGFAHVFSRRRENWWAVIPGGVLLTLPC